MGRRFAWRRRLDSANMRGRVTRGCRRFCLSGEVEGNAKFENRNLKFGFAGKPLELRLVVFARIFEKPAPLKTNGAAPCGKGGASPAPTSDCEIERRLR